MGVDNQLIGNSRVRSSELALPDPPSPVPLPRPGHHALLSRDARGARIPVTPLQGTSEVHGDMHTHRSRCAIKLVGGGGWWMVDGGG